MEGDVCRVFCRLCAKTICSGPRNCPSTPGPMKRKLSPALLLITSNNSSQCKVVQPRSRATLKWPISQTFSSLLRRSKKPSLRLSRNTLRRFHLIPSRRLWQQVPSSCLQSLPRLMSLLSKLLLHPANLSWGLIFQSCPKILL